MDISEPKLYSQTACMSAKVPQCASRESFAWSSVCWGWGARDSYPLDVSSCTWNTGIRILTSPASRKTGIKIVSVQENGQESDQFLIFFKWVILILSFNLNCVYKILYREYMNFGRWISLGKAVSQARSSQGVASVLLGWGSQSIPDVSDVISTRHWKKQADSCIYPRADACPSSAELPIATQWRW